MEPLTMKRDNAPIPKAVFPEGYMMRSFRPGDEADWCESCVDGQLGVEENTKEQFDKIMTADPRVKMENIFFLISPQGDVAGTITFQLGKTEDEGYVHMVGLKKSYWGKKLSLPLVQYCVGRILEGGKAHMTLTTDDWRLPAIKSYLCAGFIPLIDEGDEEMATRWIRVKEKLGLA